jgi:hypothetical protein
MDAPAQTKEIMGMHSELRKEVGRVGKIVAQIMHALNCPIKYQKTGINYTRHYGTIRKLNIDFSIEHNIGLYYRIDKLTPVSEWDYEDLLFFAENAQDIINTALQLADSRRDDITKALDMLKNVPVDNIKMRV